MPIPPLVGPVVFVAAFLGGGHGKPDVHANVTVTAAPQAVQLASRNSPGWWSAELAASGGVYQINARVPHEICASVTLTIPPGLYGAHEEVRIYCKR